MTVYLDHAATTPMLPEAAAAMTEQLSRVGNASSLHASGRDARRVVEESRERIARALSCRPGEVVFTSGGTEADNLAIKGMFWTRRAEDPRRTRILSTPIEHHAVLDPLHWLATEGAKVELIDVDRLGRLDLDAFRAAVEADPASVALVTVMWANNEVGTVQPVAEVVAIAHAHGIPVHTDAVQALGQLPLDFSGSDVDAMTVTGHKAGGPYGVTSARARSTLRPSPGSPSPASWRCSGSPSWPPGWSACATPWSRGCAARSLTRSTTATRRSGPSTGCPATPTWSSPAARATPC
jgi:cysteine desulfurase